MKKIIWLIIFIIIISMGACGYDNIISPTISNEISDKNPEVSGKLSLSGSTSLTKLCNSLSEAFMQKYPSVIVEKADTDSGSAPKAVSIGTAAIGDLSRELKLSEYPQEFESVTIALDGIAVIVNNNNPIIDLTSEQIKKIFMGEIKNWNEVGGNDELIALIGREESSGTREGFESAFGINNNCKYDAEYPESGDIVAKANKDSSVIGYCSIVSVYGNIHAISIDGVFPTRESIINKSYAITRPFIQIYKKGNKDKLIQLWFDFISSNEGKDIIIKEKLIPIDINLQY